MTYGQSYAPSVAILSPYITDYDSLLLPEIETFYFEEYSNPEYQKTFLEDLKSKPRNIRMMEFRERKFKEMREFGLELTLAYYGMISYIALLSTDTCLVLPSRHRCSGQINEMEFIAKRLEVRYIINPIRLHSYVKGNNKFSTARIQVFDSQSRKILLDNEYTGDTGNIGLGLACENESLKCTIDNILQQSIRDILEIPGILEREK